MFSREDNSPLSSFSLCLLQDEVNQIMETNLWLRHVSVFMFHPFHVIQSQCRKSLFHLLFRSGTTTNCDGPLWSMMESSSYEFHPIRFGGQTLSCTISEYVRWCHFCHWCHFFSEILLFNSVRKVGHHKLARLGNCYSIVNYELI